MAGLSHHRAVERSGVLMSARRLIAYVLHDPQLDDTPWQWTVELFDPASSSGASFRYVGTRYRAALDAQLAAEKNANREGFDLRWSGFVAHGVPVETSERGAQG